TLFRSKRLDPRSLRIRDEAIVHGHRGHLRLDQGSVDGTGLIPNTVRHTRKKGIKAAARLMLERASVRAPDVEAMASRDDQVLDAHQLLHDRPVTTAHDADGAACRQRAH